jgi:hypothetical protein
MSATPLEGGATAAATVDKDNIVTIEGAKLQLVSPT